MKLKKVVLVWALALLGALASVMSAQAQSPDDLGKAIAANYLDALKKVNELMKARPEAADLSPKMAALKEETIKKMVEVGQKVAKLNEAAHYFGQTIIGWTKFPNFMKNLTQAVTLPAGSSINAHMQERQNIIFTVYTPGQIEAQKLFAVKDYIQGKLDEYNSTNLTKFVLSNLDYEQFEMKKSYEYGALSALIISLIVGFGIIFLKREFFV